MHSLPVTSLYNLVLAPLAMLNSMKSAPSGGLLVVHALDMLLDELKRREEDGVHRTGAAHGHAQPAVHLPSEELYLDRRHLLAFGVHQGVALVYALCRVDRVLMYGQYGDLVQCRRELVPTNQRPRHNPTQSSGYQHSERVRMGAVTTKCRQQLFAAFVCHEVYACSKGVAHC